ncbi:MAG: hypothetical protein LAT78_01490 [Roseinatronobacter sp.]|nr:hypothetical protein [Roseinatronobacter sp.]
MAAADATAFPDSVFAPFEAQSVAVPGPDPWLAEYFYFFLPARMHTLLDAETLLAVQSAEMLFSAPDDTAPQILERVQRLADLSPPAARAIFGFSLEGLWPAGVSAWLGLQPGLQIETSGTFDPRSKNNVASLRVIDGARNAATIWQGGFGNILGPLRFWGYDNSVSVRQDGTGNLAHVGAVVGFQQSIALRQLGTNIADIVLGGFGEDNTVSVDQIGEGRVSLLVEGTGNSIDIRQDYFFGLGGDNMFEVNVQGLGNILRVEQDGNNLMRVTISGDRNNAAGTGPALSVLGIQAGDLLQAGDGNEVFVDITGSENQIGLRQSGNSGTLRTTQMGDGNQVGVVQSGDGNSAVITQTGHGNSVSMSQ